MFIYILIGVVSFLLAFYFTILKGKFNYWKTRNVKGPQPLPIFGTMANVIMVKQTMDQVLRQNYEAYPEEKVVGLYLGYNPSLLIRDPELIKHMMIKDFNLFQDRGVAPVEGKINQNLFSIEGESWRILRQKMTPLFTSGKLKNMTPLIENCTDLYVNYVNSLLKNDIEEEIRTLQSKLMLEVIGSCAFGLDLHTFSQEDNEFKNAAQALLVRSLAARFWFALQLMFPGIKDRLSLISNTSSHHEKFFINLVKNIIEERDEKPSVRKDFMDLMIELRNQGKVSRKTEAGSSEIEIDEAMIAAQAFIFYFAGFETSAATTSFLLYELAHHPDIQEKLFKEINDVSELYNGKINYDSISEMKYLEMVFDETLRKYPVVGILIRKSLEDYTFPGTNISITKDKRLFISVSGLHNDPKYFPQPEQFKPERFSPENRHKIQPYVYMPFGEGPRNCIGMRFAKVASMMGIAAFIKNFTVTPSKKTQNPLTYSRKSLTLTSENGIWLKISKR